MPWAAPKSIERPLKEPIFIRGGFRIAARGANNSDLIGREDALTECVFTITLMKGTMRRDRHACEEVERILMEDRGKFVLFFQTRSSWYPRTMMQDLA